MGENTEIREKAEEKAKSSITTYAKALGVLVSPVLIYFLQDMYTTMKEVNTQFASLQTEVREMRSGEVQNMRRTMSTMLRDQQELRVRLEVMERVYEIAPWEWEEDAGEPVRERPEEAWRAEIQREIDRLQEERDYYEEYEQQRRLEKNNAPARKR